MSRRVSAFVAIAFILFMVAVAVTTFFSCERNESEIDTPATTERSTQYKTYIVREYDGLVAVFEKHKERPVKITDTYVSSLPQGDRDNLRDGIEVNSDEKLRKLLEDLCS
ncbi:MAG: hypothetical protein UIM53_04860 [Acutalibacteraceae bacterium]|nr:hypothetical protein [Acutalibacteraceae bacterium]